MPSSLASTSASGMPGIERTLELARTYLDMDMAVLIEHRHQSDTLAEVTGFGIDLAAALSLSHLFTERRRRGRRWRVVGDTRSHASTVVLARHHIGAFISAKVICGDRVTSTLACLSREPLSFLESSDGKVVEMLAETIAARLSNRVDSDFPSGMTTLVGLPSPSNAHPVESRRPPSPSATPNSPVVLCPLCQHQLVRVNSQVGDRSITMRACSRCDLRWWESDGLLCTLTDLLETVREGVDTVG